jgi:hypothetical protein
MNDLKKVNNTADLQKKAEISDLMNELIASHERCIELNKKHKASPFSSFKFKGQLDVSTAAHENLIGQMKGHQQKVFA